MKTTVTRLSVVVGVVVLAIGLSLKLEGAPPAPLTIGAVHNTSRDASREIPFKKVESVTGGPKSAAAIGANADRVTVGQIPSTGLQVIATIEVDWRDDEGTRLRQAGKLIGPMPAAGDEAGGVADGGYTPHNCADTGPGECSFNVDCDDADPCTTDTCDFVVGAPPCTGICVYDPVKNGETGGLSGCDDGLFCNGKRTCEGSKCTAGSARHEDLPCDAHFECQTPGTCHPVLLTCTTGNIGAVCAVDDDCAVPGTGSCEGGVCTSGPVPLCCESEDNSRYCSELLAKCSADSTSAGKVCTLDSQCPNGKCERCQPTCSNDGQCADISRCNGTETCQKTCVGGPNDGDVCTGDAGCTPGVCLGQCRPGVNPCGYGARCYNKRCQNVTPIQVCTTDSDCAAGVLCVDIVGFDPPGVKCFDGRCCDPAATDALSCSKQTLANCDAIPNSLWYAMDGGEQLADTATLVNPCGGTNPADLTRDPFGCPKYSSGFTQHVAGTPPVFPVMVGPISDSQACAPAPGGPGGACAAPLGAGRLYTLGDDYKVSNASYLELEVVRLVLNVIETSRLSMDVYDKFGNFVEDVNVNFQTNLTTGLGIVVVIFRAPLTIPAEGWIVLRVSERFLANSKAFWLSTTAVSGSAGTNNPFVLWVNGYPGLESSFNSGNSNSFLKMCDGGPRANEACVTDADCPDAPTCAGGNCTCGAAPGILTFELVGDKVPAPAGACSDEEGGCVDGVVSWVCLAQGDTYLGDNSRCAKCNGGSNNGGFCRTCLGVPNVGVACTSDAQCTAGGCTVNCTCSPDTTKCRTCVGGTAPAGTPCVDNTPCIGGGTCPNLGSACSTGATGNSCNVCTNKACTRLCTTKRCTGDRVCTNKKCNGNRVCTTRQCSGSPTGRACTGIFGQCLVGQTCDYVTCTGESVCIAKTCTGPGPLTGEPCVDDTNCTGSGTCLDNSTCPAVVSPCTGTGQGTCATPNQTCDFITCSDDSPCAANGGTCPAATTSCTGTGQGTCPNNQTCSDITCTANSACTASGGTCQNAVLCTGIRQGTCANTTQTCNYVPCTSNPNCTTPPSGTGGTCQPIDDSCDVLGSCDLGSLTCTAGDVGHACISDDGCTVGGTCVPVACQPNPASAKGACCKSDPLVCNPMNTAACCTLETSELDCTNAGGDWKGFGTDCDTDNGYEAAQQHSCPIPQYTGKRCQGGPNNLQACTLVDNSECRFCVGGTHNGAACTTTTPTCLDLGTCNLTSHLCEGGTMDGQACTTEAQCPDNSGICRGRCVERGTGGDNCMDAFVHVITVPTLDEGPKTVTVSGTNLFATDSEEDEIENCPFNATDPMWWEAFSVDKCARVRLDFCGSDPVREPAWANIIGTCNPSGTCANLIGSLADVYTEGQDASARGNPYCLGEDNVWGTYGPLDPGTYWQPVYSDLAGAHGDYMFHITVQACPEAACCYQACSGGANVGLYCNKTTTCPGGTCVGGGNGGAACTEHNFCNSGVCSVTCESHCLELNEVDCALKLGYLLAPPNVAVATPLCLSDPGPCAEGSCCMGPGQCADQVSESNPAPMTAAICDENAYNGIFVGGVRCRGGHCEGGTDAGESCSVEPVGQCAGGDCVGTSTELAQPEPCPICEYKADVTCQYEPGGYIFATDTSSSISSTNRVLGNTMMDDVLISQTGMLETMCLIGTYLHFLPPQTPGAALPARVYCGEAYEGFSPATAVPYMDDFTISVYKTRDGSSLTPTNSMPGDELVGTSGATTQAKGLELTFNGTERYFRSQLQLTNPIGPLEQGRVYWIEFSNNTVGGYAACNWWTLTANDALGQGNGIMFAPNQGGKIFTQDDGIALDAPFCMNVPFESPPTPTRACCTCGPPAGCIDATLEECYGAVGSTAVPPGVEWVLDQLTCAGYTCPGAPVNDLCANALPVTDGKYDFRNTCATTDGPTPVQCVVNTLPSGPDTSDSAFERDVWFNYLATCTGQGRVTTCDADRVFDSVLAIYHNPGSATQCPCPTDASLQVGLCSDDNTDTSATASPLGCDVPGLSAVEFAVSAGSCYMIRVGGFAGAQDEGRLTVSCYTTTDPPECGNNNVESGEQCDGNSSANCPGQCRPPTDYNGCTCKAVCGKECIGGSKAGKPCTTFNPTQCPGGSACTNVVEYGEECDGTNCGAQNCRPPGDPLGGCTCPPQCGNGIKEGSELCDPDTDHAGANPDDDLCVGQCLGDCTCPRTCGNDIVEVGEACDGIFPDAPGAHPCPGRCGAVGGTAGTCDTAGTHHCTAGQVGRPCETHADCNVSECACPVPFCGNNKVESLTKGEECDGTATEEEGSACPPAECRAPNDPLGECTCGCAGALPPNTVVWGPATSGPTPCVGGGGGVWPNCNPEATTRSLRFTVTGPPGPSKPEAIKVTMIDLQHPIPPNLLTNPPQNFSGYESATCAPFKCVGGARNGLTCIAVGDCPKSCVGGTNAGTLCPNGNECTGAGASCPATTCVAAVEANGCARWVGKPGTFLESQDGGPAAGTYRAARLQCTPFYYDWKPEGLIAVVGAEIAPSSEYSVQVYGASCTGAETGCASVSPPVTMFTRRAGDTGPNFNPPATTSQPDAVDVVVLVNKFKGLAGAPVKAIAQIQPNLTELNADLSALDITAAVDGVKGVAYSFSGPCPCPSVVPCGITACANATVCVNTYGVGSTCVKTCVGGTNAGDPCINTTDPHNHCPGGGVCGAGGATPGFCRDRCGRCTP